MERETEYQKIKLGIGLVSVVVGLIASSFVLFGWVEQTGAQSILGIYGRYICGFGGFGAMIFGASLVNDFMQLRKPFIKNVALPSIQNQKVMLLSDEQIRVIPELFEDEEQFVS